MPGVFFLLFTSLFCHVHCFKCCTVQTLPEPLWGVVVWFSQWSSSAQAKCPLVHSPHLKIHLTVNTDCILMNAKKNVSGRPVMVSVECLHTGLPIEIVYRHIMMCRQMHRPTHILKAPGRKSFYHTVKFWYLHGGWFLVFFRLHLSRTGPLSLTWSPSSVESGLVDPVSSGSTSLHCFDLSEVCPLVNYLSAG